MARNLATDQNYTDVFLPFLTPPHLLKYWESLGRFVSAYSSIEVTMQLALWTFAGLSRPMARALLAGSTRIDAAMNLISKVAEAQKWKASKKRELNVIFSHLGIINKIRNDILHFGAKS